jgi:transcription elongation factor Elf1
MTTIKPVELPVREHEALPRPTCPLCHTEETTLTSQALADGGSWHCAVCGQMWNAERLVTAAVYAQTSSVLCTKVM